MGETRWEKEWVLLSQRESQGAGDPPPTVDDESSHESGEPIGETITSGLTGSHCQRRHAAPLSHLR